MDERTSPNVWEAAAGAAPGVGRIVGTAWMRSAGWALGTGARSARNLARAVTNPDAAGELVRDLATDIAGATRAIQEVANLVSSGVPLPRAVFEASITLSANHKDAKQPIALEATLRERGEELLRKSRDVWNEDTG